MDQHCDGGGNRHLSTVDLHSDSELKQVFPDLDEVPAGICSLRPSPAVDPWIVCPRRLLVMGREAAGERRCQIEIERLTVDLFGYPPGTRLGVWPEVKIKKKLTGVGEPKLFDSTFDYVLMPLGDLGRAENPELDWRKAAKWEAEGYRVENGTVRDAPVGAPALVEIMTSSTSGSNKKTETTIPKAFRRAILDGEYAEGPGINYRQVWARMASQLVVKSEVAATWGGAALWVIQDVLAQYISDTTALDLARLKADKLSEVNILSLSYGRDRHDDEGVIELPDYQLFAGPIAGLGSAENDRYGFLDIVRAGAKPPRAALIEALLRRLPSSEILVA